MVHVEMALEVQMEEDLVKDLVVVQQAEASVAAAVDIP